MWAVAMARPSKPWFRASMGTWYVKIGGKQHSLGVRGRENRSAAVAAWHRLNSRRRGTSATAAADGDGRGRETAAVQLVEQLPATGRVLRSSSLAISPMSRLLLLA